MLLILAMIALSFLHYSIFHFSHFGVLQMFTFCFYFLFYFYSFVGACVKCSLSGESSFFHFQMLKLLHFLFSLCGEIRQLRWIGYSAPLCPPHSLECSLEWLTSCAYLLALISRNYIFRVFTLLLCTCAYLLSSDGLDTTKYSAKKQTSLWRGLTWMEAYPLLLGYSRRKRDNLLWSSVTGELHMLLALIDKSKLVWWSSGCVFWQHNLWTSRTSMSELEVETATPWKDARSKME